MQSARPWGTLPSLDAQLAVEFGPSKLGNVAVTLGGIACTLGYSREGHQLRRPAVSICISATIDGEPAQLYVPPKLLDDCLSSIAPGFSYATLDPAAKALIAEAALAQSLDALEELLQAQIEINSIDMVRSQDDAAAPNLGFNIHTGSGSPRICQAVVPPAVERRLIAAWSGRIDGDAENDPRVLIALRAGLARMSRNEVEALRADDVVVFDETPLYAKRLCLMISDRLAAVGDLDGNQLMLVEKMSPVAGSWNARMSAASGDDDGRSGTEDVTLVADLLRRRVSISQLLAIDLSKPVDIPRKLEDVFDLYLDNKAIASGQIVKVGAAIGFRLVKVVRNE